MQSMIPAARNVCSLTILFALVCGILLYPGELQGAETLPLAAEAAEPLAASLGVRFVEGSSSSVILERDGKEYVVDLAARTIREVHPPLVATEATAEAQQVTPAQSTVSGQPGAAIFQQQCSSCHGADGKGSAGAGTPDLTDFRARSGIPGDSIVSVITNGRSGTSMQAFAGRLSTAQIRDVAAFVQTLSAQTERMDLYEAPDDFVYSLPTGRPVPRGGLYVNFAHRFAYDPAFSGAGLGNILFGLDGFSVSSFGLRYGVTDKLSISAYRSPSIIGRPIELMAAYTLMDEYEDHPFNAAIRVSVSGQDNFRRNFTTNFEGIVSRSITNRAQFYAVPTFSIDNRRLNSHPGPTLERRLPELPGIDSFSVGAGLAVNIRPSLAIVAEVIPTLVHADDLDIHRPAYGIGIQKRVSGHAFTLGFSTGPGTVVAQRAGTRATLLNDPAADKPSGLFFGFNLMRRLR